MVHEGGKKIPPIKSTRLSQEENNKEDDIKNNHKNLINIGMIGNSKSIVIIWSWLFPKVAM